jgi:hypothetical protein
VTLDNVVPIDALTAQMLEQRRIRFRWFVAGLAAVWVALLVPVLVYTPLPPLAPFVVLALLVVLAEHQFVLFGDETSMSASIIVVVASIFVFADTSPLAGPMLIASLGGLYLPHIRRRDLAKVLFNGGAMGVSALAAAALAPSHFVDPTFVPDAFRAIAGIGTYWILNNLLVAAHQTIRFRHDFRRDARYLVSSDTEILGWALMTSLGVATMGTYGRSGIPFVALVVAVRAVGQRFRTDSDRLPFGTRGVTAGAVALASIVSFRTSDSLAPWELAVALTLVCASARVPTTPNRQIWITLVFAFLASSAGNPALAVTTLLFAVVVARATFHSTGSSMICMGTSAAVIAAYIVAALVDEWMPLYLVCVLTIAVPMLAAAIASNLSSLGTLWKSSPLLALGLLIPQKSTVTVVASVAALAVLSYPHLEVVVPALLIAAALAGSTRLYRPINFGLRFSLKAASPS